MASGASHEFGMLGLGDVVLPALTLAFARRVDLAQQADTAAAQPVPARLLQPRRASGCARGCGGCFLWAVVGYAIGLAVTLAANAYGWTINDVKGQVPTHFPTCQPARCPSRSCDGLPPTLLPLLLAPRSSLLAPCSSLVAPCSLLVAPCSLLLAPFSLLLARCSLLLACLRSDQCIARSPL